MELRERKAAANSGISPLVTNLGTSRRTSLFGRYRCWQCLKSLNYWELYHLVFCIKAVPDGLRVHKRARDLSDPQVARTLEVQKKKWLRSELLAELNGTLSAKVPGKYVDRNGRIQTINDWSQIQEAKSSNPSDPIGLTFTSTFTRLLLNFS